MNTKLRRSLALSLLLAAACFTGVHAQTTATAPATAPAEFNPLSALPASDAVIYADTRRLMTELLPHIMAYDPLMLAKITGALEMVKAKTGVNVMGIERVAIGLRLLGPVGPQFKKENLGVVIVAHGDFDANALVAFAKTESHGKLSEQTYGGKVVYSEPAPEPPKTKPEAERPAFAVLDANTLVIGDLVEVRAAVDAAAGTGRVDPELARLATQDANAVIGIGLSFSPSAVRYLSASVGPDEAAQAGIRFVLATVKQVSFSAGFAPGAFTVAYGVRFCDAEQAQGMADVLTAVSHKAAADDPKLAPLLEGIKVQADGSDVRVRAEIKGEALRNLGTMFAEMNKPKPPPAVEGPTIVGPPAVPPDSGIKPPTKATQRRRSRRRGR